MLKTCANSWLSVSLLSFWKIILASVAVVKQKQPQHYNSCSQRHAFNKVHCITTNNKEYNCEYIKVQEMHTSYLQAFFGFVLMVTTHIHHRESVRQVQVNSFS